MAARSRRAASVAAAAAAMPGRMTMLAAALLALLLALGARARPAFGLDASTPYEAYDRNSMAGAARGLRAAGQPRPVRGLAAVDRPALGPRSASMEDLVLPYGYPLETYPVETDDGFVLRMYRIPHGLDNGTGTKGGPRPVVLLHHGITLASSCFAVLDPGSSMAFYLADAGFDVWMANTRGNTYSRGHRHHRSSEPAYWAHSMDELALLDLPAQIDFALGLAGAPSLAILGHSQGCTLPLMLLAARPEYHEKIWLLALLGPVVHAEAIEAPFLGLQAANGGLELMRRTGIGGYMPNTQTSAFSSQCTAPRMAAWCCDIVNLFFAGPSLAKSVYDIHRISSTWPATVSARNLIHWAQLYRRGGGLAMFDFGADCSKGGAPVAFEESCNQAKYGQAAPPDYDLSLVGAKAAVFSSPFDQMSTPDDVNRLLAEWGAEVVLHKVYPQTAHLDFVWARAPIMKDEIIGVLWAHAPQGLAADSPSAPDPAATLEPGRAASAGSAPAGRANAGAQSNATAAGNGAGKAAEAAPTFDKQGVLVAPTARPPARAAQPQTATNVAGKAAPPPQQQVHLPGARSAPAPGVALLRRAAAAAAPQAPVTARANSPADGRAGSPATAAPFVTARSRRQQAGA